MTTTKVPELDWLSDGDGALLDDICKALRDRKILLEACKAAVTMFKIREDSLLPDDIKALAKRSFQNDPVCQQLLAAIAEAEGVKPT